MAQSLGGSKTFGLICAALTVGSVFISFFSGWATSIKQDGMVKEIRQIMTVSTLVLRFVKKFN